MSHASERRDRAAVPDRHQPPSAAPAGPAAGPAEILRLQRLAGNRAVQRVRVRLKDEDQSLMARLRKVHLPNEGNQVAADPSGVKGLAEIGADEDIIFEGHGETDDPVFGAKQVVGQGGLNPKQLAVLAHTVPKPAGWRGRIVLLGCETGNITAAVSKAYFELAGAAVLVVGTPKSIRVGTDDHGQNFVGADWTDYPSGERPADFADRFKLERTFTAYTEAERGFDRVVNKVTAFVGTVKAAFDAQKDDVLTKGVTINANVELTELGPIVDHAKALRGLCPGQYAHAERNALVAHFERQVLAKLLKVPYFAADRLAMTAKVAVSPGDGNGYEQAIDVFVDAVDAAAALAAASITRYQGEALRLHNLLNGYLLGLTLKRYDLDDPASGVHSKMVRTEKNTFLPDVWVDQAAAPAKAK